MGTHPIFESDFDCLTDFKIMCEEGEDDEFFDALDTVDGIEKRWDRLMV